ncbi:hypothetical protein FDT66_02850 [Polaribacter aestuariivivens]|uniref:Uncharacterized protein n=1 Tax=Polaribacter aestuariivivens TaxID=2304626 RepID=A0A5S3NAT2_9FLAO|nr:hypothetical protein [Polaribacter aestuariivivens]TMM32418.1 hypothetical protein FDT66_02850 [Polaribacter aestuariivivens]
MIKYKKIRGHNRILKDIEDWKNYNKDLDLEYLDKAKRNYCKFWVNPFCDIAVLGSEIPTPKGKIRSKIIDSFIEIYDAWDAKLKTLNKPYHLVLWLFENNLERSQVVCAIDGLLDFYKISFYRPKNQKEIPLQNFGKLSEKLSEFNWIYAHEEGYFTEEDVKFEIEMVDDGEVSDILKWYKQKRKTSYRTFTNEEGVITYYQKLGNIWIGSKNGYL